MKNYYIYSFIPLFLYSLMGSLYAQERTALNPNPYTSSADAQFALLDKSEISTDILYERVYPFADLLNFNQTQIDTSNAAHFKMAYVELQVADYLNRFPRYTTITSNISQLPENNVPLGFINVDFNTIDRQAIDDNLLYIDSNDKLQDVTNRPYGPYFENTSLVASNLTKSVKGTTVQFKTESTYNLFAANNAITSIQIDFNTGNGYQTIQIPSTHIVTYASIGTKYITYKITYADNTIKYTRSRLEVLKDDQKRDVAPLDPGCDNLNVPIPIQATIPFQGYNEPVPSLGEGEYLIRRGGNSVNRPVIVVDGFDPLEGTNDGTNLEDIEDFLLAENFLLIDELLQENFDIIPLNFTEHTTPDGRDINGGTDYVERNAMVLVELINTINECKAGIFPIKIVGFSMGGLVARYALAFMEQENISHNVDLYISVDSPHKGATVPIGIQETADLLDDLVPFDVGETGTRLLDTPAAKQLLEHHYLANSKPPVGAPNFHDRFYNDLDALGFPQLSRNIAVVNGVATGLSINNPGQRYLNGNIETGLFYFPIGAKINTLIDYAPDRGLTRNALDFTAGIKLGFITYPIFKRIRQTTTLSTPGSFENSPGGFYPSEALTNAFFGDKGIYDPINNNFLSTFIASINFTLTDANFSFIPVKSGLAYTGPIDDLYEDFSRRNLVCSGYTPFDSYFTAIGDNEIHISLNHDSAQYIFDELMGTMRLPNVDYTNTPISGPHWVCNGDTVIYEKGGCASPDVVSWSASSNLTILNEDAQSVTVIPISNQVTGEAFVSGILVTGEIITRQLWLGLPEQPGAIQGPEDVLSQTVYQYTTSGSPGTDVFIWRLPDPFNPIDDIRNPIDENSDHWQMRPTETHLNNTVFTGNGMHDGFITVRGVNSCGESFVTSLAVDVTGPCNPCRNHNTYVVPVPNAANEEFELDFANHPPGTYYIYIFDANSNIMYQGETENYKKTVSTSTIPSGTYYLHIQDGTEVTSQQLVIQH